MTERADPSADLSTSIDPRQSLCAAMGILGVTLEPRIAEMYLAFTVGELE